MAHERLHLWLAEVTPGGSGEPATEALHPGDAKGGSSDVEDQPLALQNHHPCCLHPRPHLVLAVGVIVVVAQHRHDRNRQPPQLVGQHRCLRRVADPREVPRDQQHVCMVPNVLEVRSHRPRGIGAEVEVADGSDPDHGRRSTSEGSDFGFTVV